MVLDNGASVNHQRRPLPFDEAVSDGEPVVESCPVCGGVTAHVLGCSRMDVAR